MKARPAVKAAVVYNIVEGRPTVMMKEKEQQKKRHIVEMLKANMPPMFPAAALDAYTGGAVRWRNLQNRKCRDEIPADCFVKSHGRILILRDNFLDWWSETLSTAQSTKNIDSVAVTKSPAVGGQKRVQLRRGDRFASAPTHPPAPINAETEIPAVEHAQHFSARNGRILLPADELYRLEEARNDEAAEMDGEREPDWPDDDSEDLTLRVSAVPRDAQ